MNVVAPPTGPGRMAQGQVTVGTMGQRPGSNVPPIRQVPTTEDKLYDGARLTYAWKRWDGQTQALRLRDRQVEENVRMLCGQQNIVWNATLQRYVDVTHWMTDEERRWRQRPVFNKLRPWFMTTHARLTENPPIITFLPGPDAIDNQLAEVMDTIAKSLWRELGMLDVNDRLMSWMIVAGRGLIHTRLDMTKGPMKQWIGRATLPVLQGDGNPMLGPDGAPIMQVVDNVPFDQQGNALAILTAGGLQPTGEPHFEREGELTCDVLSPLEARAQWGGQPWHKKSWMAVKSYMTPDEVYDKWGVIVEPDTDGISGESTNELERLLFGAGYFGAASGKLGTDLGAPQSTTDKYCEVLTYYELPSRNQAEPRLEQTPSSPGGRMMIATRKRVLVDAVRPLAWKSAGPIRCFDFERIPGRPQGSTPQENLNGPVRAYNRTWASIIEHTRLMTNPIALVDSRAGLALTAITNAPGQKFQVTKIAGVEPLEYVAPPPLGADVYKALQLLDEVIADLGSTHGTDGAPPTQDASGELVKELTFIGDRYVGPAMRRAVEEYARWWEDIREFIKLLWDREKVITYAGQDSVARTIVVYPYLLQNGTVDIVPDVESMIPEGRGERQAKVYKMWADGMFGMPQSPQAVAQYLSLANFPNLSRAARPGGEERATAEQILGRLMQGDPSVIQLWWPWYTPAIHLDSLVSFAAGPEFLKQPFQIQQIVMARWQFVMAVAQQQMMPMPPTSGPQLPPAPTLGGPGPLAQPSPQPQGGGPTAPQVQSWPPPLPGWQPPAGPSQQYGRSAFPLPAGPPPTGLQGQGGPSNEPMTGGQSGPPGTGRAGAPLQLPAGAAQPLAPNPAAMRPPTRPGFPTPTQYPSTRMPLR